MPANAPLPKTDLSEDELKRYSRHILMPEVGKQGQLRLKAAKALVVGVGGLGAPVAMYLAAAGVGTLGLVDFDVVDCSNLQRQIAFGGKDVGKSKAQTARQRMLEINDRIDICIHETELTSENAMEILQGYDIVIDGTDNFPTRYLVNDACALLGKPVVYGSIFRFEGQLSVFWAEKGPCYRCLYPEPPPPGAVPNCAEAGVMGALPGIIGSLQAMEAIKLIVGIGEPMIGRLLLFDALGMGFREVNLKKDKACPLCGDNPVIREPIDYQRFCRAGGAADEISPRQVKNLMDSGQNFTLLDVREPLEWNIAHIEGAKLVPLGELEDRLGELDASIETLVICRSGQRSAAAVRILREAGFRCARNIVGGINRWSDEVDRTLEKY